MNETSKSRSKWLHIRLKEEEYDKVHKKFSGSTCRKLSEYARRVLLEKAITVNQRNKSLDDFMAEMIALRNELNVIGNNFNQAVRKLHTLQQIPDFKTWILMHEKNRQQLQIKVEEIKSKINQLSDKWLQ